MNELSDSTLRFIREHLSCDTRRLALSAAKYPDVDMPAAVTQIAARQTAAKKIPSWAAVGGILYPGHLSMEQCSSEAAARYKASLVSGGSFVDLTGGLGVDFSFIARRFREADYVERQEGLCELAAHNLPLLGLGDARVHNASAEEFLNVMPPADCIYLDPSRRDCHGGRTVRIAGCEPDINRLEPQLLDKGRRVMVKLSPMLDIAATLRELHCVSEVHIVSSGNECKELLLILEADWPQEATVWCVSVPDGEVFSFTLTEEKNAPEGLAGGLQGYLYEPDAALMKAGCFKLLAQRTGTGMLSANSHLYTSDTLVTFPGRRFAIEGVSGFGKRELRSFLSGVERANIAVRNFPSSADELRKRLKLRDGGDVFLFATTLSGGDKVLIKAVKN